MRENTTNVNADTNIGSRANHYLSDNITNLNTTGKETSNWFGT